MKKFITLLFVVFTLSVFGQNDGKTIDRLFEHFPEDSVLLKNEKGQFWVHFDRDLNREGEPLAITARIVSNDYPALAELIYETILLRKNDGFEETPEKPYTEAVLHRQVSDGWSLDIVLRRGEEFYHIQGQRDWDYESDLLQRYVVTINFIDRDRRSGEVHGEFKF
jgi:hypothetical protein